LTRAGEI